MQFHFASVLVFLLVACVFLAVTLLLGKLIRPHTPDRTRARSTSAARSRSSRRWFNFNPRFYIVALIFLIFDVEVAFTYPVAMVFKRWVAIGQGGLAFVELLAFVAILVARPRLRLGERRPRVDAPRPGRRRRAIARGRE